MVSDLEVEEDDDEREEEDEEEREEEEREEEEEEEGWREGAEDGDGNKDNKVCIFSSLKGRM